MWWYIFVFEQKKILFVRFCYLVHYILDSFRGIHLNSFIPFKVFALMKNFMSNTAGYTVKLVLKATSE